MPELTEVETPKNAGFVQNKSTLTANRKRIEQDEAELKALMEGRTESPTEEESTEKKEAENLYLLAQNRSFRIQLILAAILVFGLLIITTLIFQKRKLFKIIENENNLNFINKTTQIFQGDEYIGATCSSGFFKVTDADNDGDYDIIRETGQPRASSECMNINGWINSNGILSKYRF